MPISKKVFIDESVLYAFIDRSDTNHKQAVKILQQFSLSHIHVYTSIQSIQDTHNAVSKQMGSVLGEEFLKAILESNIEVLFPQRSDLVSSYKLIKLNGNKQINIKEAITATLMQKRGISQILTFAYWQNLLGSISYLSKM